MIFLGLGQVYLSRPGYLREAEKMLHRGLNLCNQLGDKRGTAIAYSRLGHLELKHKRYPKAIVFFQSARDLFADLKDMYYNVSGLIDEANLRYEQGQEQEVIRLAQEAAKLAKEYGFLHHAARAQMWQADALLRQGHIETGMQLYCETSKLVAENDFLMKEVLERVSKHIKHWEAEQPGLSYAFIQAMQRFWEQVDPQRQQTIVWEWLTKVGEMAEVYRHLSGRNREGPPMIL